MYYHNSDYMLIRFVIGNYATILIMKIIMRKTYIEDKHRCWSEGIKDSDYEFFDIFYYSKLWSSGYCQSYIDIDDFKF